MVDFFVRENPLLPPEKSREDSVRMVPRTADLEPATLLDYEEFGFPDSQVVREWTVWGCLTVIVCSVCILFGIAILGYTFWNMYTEHNIRTNTVTTGNVVLKNSSQQSMSRAVVTAFSIHCQWNYPSAISVTPDGKYLITAGGPRTQAEDSSTRTSRRDEETEAADFESQPTDEDFDAKKEVRFLSYDSRPAALPSSDYIDYLNLGKNGKRTLDSIKPLRKEENQENSKDKNEEGLDVNIKDLLSDSSLPTLAELEAEHLNSAGEVGIWRKTRPSVESYPMAFWSMDTMQPLVVYWNHEYPVVSIAISPDGTKVVSADSGGNAILWSLDSLPGENGVETPTWHFVNKMTPKMRTLQHMGRVETIHAVTFTPSGRQFVLGATVAALDETGNSYSSCGALILWDIENWREVLRYRGSAGVSEKIDTYYQTFNPVGKYCDLQYTPNGKYLIAAAAGANAGVYYFDNRTNNPSYGICMADLKTEEQRPRKSQSSEFKPNLIQGVSHHDFPNADSVALGISFEATENGNKNVLTIVSADNYGRIAFWEFAPKTNRPREGVFCKRFWSTKNSENTTRNVRKVLYAPNNKVVMFLGDEILIYNGAQPYDYMGTFQAVSDKHNTETRNDYFLVSGYFTPDSKYFFGGGDDCEIRMWNFDDIPMDSRFLAEHPGKERKKGEDAPKNFEEIQKQYKSLKDAKANSKSKEEEEDEEWEVKKEERSETQPLERNLPFTDQINDASAKIFKID